MPFLITRTPSAVESLRAAGLRYELAGRRPVFRPIAYFAMAIGWIITATVGAARAARADVAQCNERFWPRLRAYSFAALAHNATPDDMQRLHTRTGRDVAEAPELLFNRDRRIWYGLNAIQGAEPNDVQDKARFASICREHSLPAVPVLAAFFGGKLVVPPDCEAMAGRDLFTKSLRGNLGQGAALWQWNGNGWSCDGETCATLEILLTRLSSEDCVVQRALIDHQVFRAAGSKGLSSLRIVTICPPDGRARAIAATMLLSRGTISQTGAILGIDMDRGQAINCLDLAINKVLTLNEVGIVLSALPDWQAHLDLVCHAHEQAFPRFASLGWDVVLTDEGPFLLEANLGWGMLLHETLDRAFGATALVEAAPAWSRLLNGTPHASFKTT
jgi:Sugar-transfer associated ATP-grasp